MLWEQRLGQAIDHVPPRAREARARGARGEIVRSRPYLDFLHTRRDRHGGRQARVSHSGVLTTPAHPPASDGF